MIIKNMCGIYGVSEFNIKLVDSLISASSHRGPDGRGVWSNTQVTLGHNLLAITDSPKSSNQPMVSELENVLIYNGEIFNYEELLTKFHNKFFPKTNCDTELLSWLLDNFEPLDVIENIIDSMHAFAYYDQKKNHLILSRDHAGIKPLYYIEEGNKIIFGSEIKGLLEFACVQKKIHLPALVSMAQLGMNFFRNTMFENIKKVMPGETLTFDLTKKKFIKSNRITIKPTSTINLKIEEFRHEVKQTIRQSTLGIRKFGIFLSGGLDSSIIANEYANLFNGFMTYTNYMKPNIHNSIEDYNEDFNIAKKFTFDKKLTHKGVEITPDIIAKNWQSTIHYMEEPRYNWNMPMYYFTNQFIANDGVTITISGDMGDELLGGYPRYYEFSKLSKSPTTKKDLIKIWMKRFKNPISLNLKFKYQDLVDELCRQLPDDVWNPEDPLNSFMALDCITLVPEDFFNRNDKFGMAASMEGRFPFASKRFMKYCLGIKSKFKIGNNVNELKLPFRHSYKDIIPGYIINKAKTGWSLPITFWLNISKNLQQSYIDIVNRGDSLQSIIKKENYFKPKPRIIAWMMRSWAQQYNLSINQ